MQIHLSSLGCRLNEAELETWSAEFVRKGHSVVPDPADADILVLNTCAVTQEAVRKSRQSVQRLHRQNPAAKMVVSGCYVALADSSEKQRITEALGVDLLVTNQDKDQLVTLTEQHLALASMPAAATDPAASSLFQRSRQRAFIKIQDGCRYRCTFCIVTVARGAERSRTTAELINEINYLHAGGVQEVVLTGVHVGGYGCDLGTDLYSLVNTILAETDIPRIRFASVEPWDLPEEFLALFTNRRLMPHMHLPLQSGSDSVLRRMSRRCKTRDFSRLVEQIRTQIPGFNITTDIIVGFPGESDREWQESLEYVESIGFGHIHIFSYSPREGTKAAGLPDQLDRSVKRLRSQALHTVAANSKRRTQENAVGACVEVLWERPKLIDGSPHYFGYTPNYLKICVTGPTIGHLENAVTETHIIGISKAGRFDRGDCLLGSSAMTLKSQPPLASCPSPDLPPAGSAQEPPASGTWQYKNRIDIKPVIPRITGTQS